MNGPSRALPLPLTPAQSVSLIGSITRAKCIRPGTHLHALLLTSGLLSPFLSSKLAAMYSLSGRPDAALHLFDRMPTRTTFLYNTLIRGYVQTDHHAKSLHLFSQMHASSVPADNFTYPFALKACGELLFLRLGAQIHSMTVRSGFSGNGFVSNSLISMYMNCNNEYAAGKVFDDMGAEKSVVSWNTMIAGLVYNGSDWEALAVFDRMVRDGVQIDRATAVSVLPACAHLGDLERGKRVHEIVEEYGFGADLPVRNSLIDMYAKCGRLEEARRVFDDDELGEKDVVSWTAMVGAYTLNGRFVEAFDLSYRMQLSGTRPNSVTMACLLSACGTLPSGIHGKCIHGACIRLALGSDIVVETALVDMYSKCGCVDSSWRVFVIGSRRTATWNALLSGFTRNGRSQVSIKQFKWMMLEGVSPNSATIASLLPAYSHSGDLKQAINIHCYLLRMGFLRSVEATTGLIDVYAKVGCLDVAWKLFDGLPVKDFVAWSAIIGGYGAHGRARTAIWLLDRMVGSGVEPNEVTFTSLLYSCSHAGLVDEGLQLFERMAKTHRLRPRDDHYACVVDLLSRAGRLEEAYDVVRSMPCDDKHAVWGALLGGCVTHSNVELGRVAAERLFEIEPENTGNYVLLGNIYAAVGRWEDAENLRRISIEMGLKKEPGRSLIEAK
ncbi:pentatricopeptide repeat-containing protein [Iris pallida]|uniref:Pentatricopeptide repeat-containing protein n=1 Tax=Iris pallida TaxID=29817 RepID=A0AAX6EJL6_IRIPA|nr:pentatricopeptide repeat-containing protein [Iris pallida]